MKKIVWITVLRDEYFEIVLKKECPKNKGWYHFDLRHVVVEIPLILKHEKELECQQEEIERLNEKMMKISDALSVLSSLNE